MCLIDSRDKSLKTNNFIIIYQIHAEDVSVAIYENLVIEGQSLSKVILQRSVPYSTRIDTIYTFHRHSPSILHKEYSKS